MVSYAPCVIDLVVYPSPQNYDIVLENKEYEWYATTVIFVLQPALLNRMQSGNQLAEKLLVSQLPSATNTGQNNTSSSSSSVKPTHQASKPPTADITSMSLASLFENTESGQFGLGFGSGGLLGLRGAMPKMPSFRVCYCYC